ncbi:MAG: isochorismate synthase [Puniceicoccales bacterium]|jgi:menaquinone-specific isochorismate synthase|nr:isochorismate synthase [Puniceicoccales bacterium]
MPATRLISISRRVRCAEPLAALLARTDGDFGACFEHPTSGTAFAGVGAAWHAVFHGKERFRRARDAANTLMANAIFDGDVRESPAMMHFFAAFSFENDAPEDAPFAPGNVFLPRWQIVRSGEQCFLVKNNLVRSDITRSEIAAIVNAANGDALASELRLDDAPLRLRSLLDAQRVAPVFTEEGGSWFSAGVADVLRRISNGDARKIVLARRLRATAPIPFSIPATFARLRETFPPCHTFAFACGADRIFTGSTPECLVDVAGGILNTEAIAGSAPRPTPHAAPEPLAACLLADAKERREHTTVVETILASLRTLGIEARAADRAHCLALPYILHLRTPLRASVSNKIHLLDIAAALHPTSATGGVPTAAALDAIRSLEPNPRSLYAGTLGWFDAAGEGRLLVGLRSALISGNDALLFAGAGIVAGSLPSRELAETQAKFRAMADALVAPLIKS